MCTNNIQSNECCFQTKLYSKMDSSTSHHIVNRHEGSYTLFLRFIYFALKRLLNVNLFCYFEYC